MVKKRDTLIFRPVGYTLFELHHFLLPVLIALNLLTLLQIPERPHPKNLFHPQSRRPSRRSRSQIPRFVFLKIPQAAPMSVFSEAVPILSSPVFS